MRWWTFCVSLVLIVSSGFAAQAQERCVLRFDRDDVDVVRGEIRIDLNRRIQRECRGISAANIRLDQVTVELRDAGRAGDRRDDRYNRRSGRGGSIVPIYRFYNGRKHRVSDDPSEGERLGYGTEEGVVFNLFRDGGRNRKPIYSCSTGKADHFLSLQADCEGQTREGQLGFIADSADGTASRPLYRCFNGKAGDHIATMDQNECTAAKYAVESTLGYVP